MKATIPNALICRTERVPVWVRVVRSPASTPGRDDTWTYPSATP